MYHIVIVEDEPIERESLQRIVSQCVDNAVVHEAATGKQAIQLIDALASIDMMLVDINIPLPNGKEVIEYLQHKHQETKVLVTSANDDFELVRSMLSLHVTDYLLKPVKKSILTETIQRTLGLDNPPAANPPPLKQSLLGLLEQQQWAQWHPFLLEHLNAAFAQAAAGKEARHDVVAMLDLLRSYLQPQGARATALCAHLQQLAETTTREGLSPSLYARLLIPLLRMSAKLFALPAAPTNRSNDFIARAKWHIECHLLDNMTLDNIAEHAFVSTCYLSRAFKKSEGIGFANYVTQRKLHIACALLQYSDLQVNAIALELAWQDANYFCRLFKKELGVAPTEYRLNSANALSSL